MGLQVWLRGKCLSRLLFQMGSRAGTHIVAGRVGLHRILGGQRYAAHGNDHEDAHLEVAQVQDVMAQPAKAVGGAGSHSDCRLLGPSPPLTNKSNSIALPRPSVKDSPWGAGWVP